MGHIQNTNSRDIFLVLKEADSIVMHSDAKMGKMTLSLYLCKLFFEEKVLFFSPKDSYLFNKKIALLEKQHPQFENISKQISPYYLKEDWDTIKRQYGYGFLLIELEMLIESSDEKIIIFHHFGEFFEFQDRYEIEHFYQILVKIVTKNKKKIIFLVDKQNINYQYIQNVAHEFSDIIMTIYKNETNERLVNIHHITENQEYPLMHFVLHKKIFILEYKDKNIDVEKKRVKNILIMELNSFAEVKRTKIKDIYNYVFNRPEFNLYHANSLQSILQNIFIKPDVIIVLMDRSKDNFAIIKAIKNQLPYTIITTVIDQDYVRSENIQEAYEYGCDEVFPRTYSFDKFILFFQKTVKNFFYTESLKVIQNKTNILNTLDEFKNLVDVCLDNKIFFTFLLLERDKVFDDLATSMRKLDFIYQDNKKIYYLALNTMPYHVDIILQKHASVYQEENHLIASCTALNSEVMEEYL